MQDDKGRIGPYIRMNDVGEDAFSEFKKGISATSS